MREKAKMLIKKSESLPEEKKALYSNLVGMLPEDSLRDFVAILEDEQRKIAEIKEQSQQEKLNQSKIYFDKIDELFKKGKAEAIEKEELEDVAKGEELLKQLDSL